MDQWDIYFASLVAMSIHPGYTRQDTEQPTIKQLADLADEMKKERDTRQWLSTQQQ